MTSSNRWRSKSCKARKLIWIFSGSCHQEQELFLLMLKVLLGRSLERMLLTSVKRLSVVKLNNYLHLMLFTSSRLTEISSKSSLMILNLTRWDRRKTWLESSWTLHQTNWENSILKKKLKRKKVKFKVLRLIKRWKDSLKQFQRWLSSKL